MQTNGMSGEARLYRNSLHCFQLIVETEGWRTLFAGLYANMVRAVPGAAIQFWAYELCKDFFGV